MPFIFYYQLMRELSSGPEAHLFRTPGSSLAERIHPVRCSTRAFSPSGARGEHRDHLRGPQFRARADLVRCISLLDGSVIRENRACHDCTESRASVGCRGDRFRPEPQARCDQPQAEPRTLCTARTDSCHASGQRSACARRDFGVARAARPRQPQAAARSFPIR